MLSNPSFLSRSEIWFSCSYLRELGLANLTSYLVAQYQHPDRLIRIGVDSESIRIHRIARPDFFGWLSDAQSQGKLIDIKLLAGFYAAEAALGKL